MRSFSCLVSVYLVPIAALTVSGAALACTGDPEECGPDRFCCNNNPDYCCNLGLICDESSNLGCREKGSGEKSIGIPAKKTTSKVATKPQDVGDAKKPTLETAKALIDTHLAEIKTIAKRKGDRIAAADLASLENLARAEAEMTRTMDADARAKALAYAATKFKEIPIDFTTRLNKTSVPELRLEASGKVFTERTAESSTCGSRAEGFIVCYVQCCSNGAGRGVAAGLGCWDCGAHVNRDGCPVCQ